MNLRILGVGLMALGGGVWLAACSSFDPGTGQTGNSAGGGMGVAGATSAGSTAAGASSAAGSNAGGADGHSGSAGTVKGGTGGSMVTAGAAGASTGGSGGSAGTSATPYDEGPFTCSMYIGAYLSMEWWNQGFQNGVDDSKWQLKWHHHGHITEWAKPESPFWLDTGNANDDSMGAPINSKCAQNSDAPDRIVFLALSWALTSETAWTQALDADIANIKSKYPSVKRVDVMTMIRCPKNMQCNPKAKLGTPDSDTNASIQDCQVPAFADAAIAKLIAANPGYVALGPQFESTMCNAPADSPNHNGAHMTDADNKIAAMKMAAFYAAKP